MTGLIAAIVGYVCGSFPSALVLTRRATGADIRTEGSGNPGAANVARTAGFKVGIAVAILDILKGFLPVMLARWLGVGHPWVALTAIAAVLGHDFSFLLRGKGGKGVATTLGVALALAPLAALPAIGIWIAVMAASRYSSVASLLSLLALPIIAWLTGSPPAYVWATGALLALALIKHRENLIRLVHGQERKFTRVRPASGG